MTVTEATGADDVAVVPLTTFESAPNTAFTFSVPRKAMSWNWYAVDAARPSTVQDRFAPIAPPASGVAHVPPVTSDAEPHKSGLTA